MNKNQNGFAILEALLILVIITVISGVGWYAIHTKHQTDKILAQSEKTSQSTSVNNLQTKYLKIKEWGVKIPLVSANSDGYYHINTNTPNYAYVSVMSVYNVQGCALSDDNTTGSGVIYRFKHDDVDPMTNKSQLSLTPDAVKIGDYYYWYEKDNQAACTAQTDAQDKVSAASDAFADNITKIQAN